MSRKLLVCSIYWVQLTHCQIKAIVATYKTPWIRQNFKFKILVFRFFRSRLSKLKAKYIESWYNNLSETYENKKTPNLTVKIQATF